MPFILFFLTISLFTQSVFADFIYSGEIQYAVQGLEFRNHANFPDDKKAPGHDKKAQNDLAEYCASLRQAISNQIGSALISLECIGAKNVSKRAEGKLYRATAHINTSVEALIIIKGVKIEGAKINANDHSSDPFKWQKSRQVARDSYLAKCQEYKTKVATENPNNVIAIDCGLMEDDGGATGWRFFSTSQAMVRVDINTIPKCSNGKYEDQIWWDILSDAIREPITCEFGGRRTDIYNKEVESKCDNQKVSATGKTKKGDFQRTEGQCLPPAACGNRPHDQRWNEVNENNPYREPVTCEFGGNREELYERVTNYHCYNGSISNLGETKGSYLGSRGSCNQPARCGGHDHGENWREVDRNNPYRESVSCEFGGNKENLYERITRYSCYNGSTRNQGEERGNFIRTTGSCNEPASCNGHSHGSNWWEKTGRIQVPAHCPHGGNRADIYEEETSMTCHNGHTSRGQTRRGRHQGTEGECRPAPRDCGSHRHGSNWWEKTGRIQVPAHCPHGGNKVDVYEEETQMSCNDGSVSRGQTRRGSHLESRGECNTPPRSCGNHEHGSSWWEATGGQIREPVRCPHGGDTVDVFAEEVRMSCRDGNTSRGETRKGSRISSEGSCRDLPPSDCGANCRPTPSGSCDCSCQGAGCKPPHPTCPNGCRVDPSGNQFMCPCDSSSSGMCTRPPGGGGLSFIFGQDHPTVYYTSHQSPRCS